MVAREEDDPDDLIPETPVLDRLEGIPPVPGFRIPPSTVPMEGARVAEPLTGLLAVSLLALSSLARANFSLVASFRSDSTLVDVLPCNRGVPRASEARGIFLGVAETRHDSERRLGGRSYLSCSDTSRVRGASGVLFVMEEMEQEDEMVDRTRGLGVIVCALEVESFLSGESCFVDAEPSALLLLMISNLSLNFSAPVESDLLFTGL